MNQLGYCALKDGKVVGLCPIGLKAAQGTVARYKEHHKMAKFEIVPIFSGQSVVIDNKPAPIVEVKNEA